MTSHGDNKFLDILRPQKNVITQANQHIFLINLRPSPSSHPDRVPFQNSLLHTRWEKNTCCCSSYVSTIIRTGTSPTAISMSLDNLVQSYENVTPRWFPNWSLLARWGRVPFRLTLKVGCVPEKLYARPSLKTQPARLYFYSIVPLFLKALDSSKRRLNSLLVSHQISHAATAGQGHFKSSPLFDDAPRVFFPDKKNVKSTTNSWTRLRAIQKLWHS